MIILLLLQFWGSVGHYLDNRPCKICYNLLQNHRSDRAFQTMCTVSCSSEWREKDCQELCKQLQISGQPAEVLCPPICARALGPGQPHPKFIDEETCANSQQIKDCLDRVDELTQENQDLQALNSALEKKNQEYLLALNNLQSKSSNSEPANPPTPQKHESSHEPVGETETLEPTKTPDFSTEFQTSQHSSQPTQLPSELKQDIVDEPIPVTIPEYSIDDNPHDPDLTFQFPPPEIPIFFQPRQEPEPPVHFFPLLVFCALLAFFFRIVNEYKHVEPLADWWMNKEPWDPKNMQIAVFYPIGIDILISLAFLLVGSIVVPGSLWALVSFNYWGADVSPISAPFAPFLLAYCAGNQAYLFWNLFNVERKRARPAPTNIVLLFQQIGLMLLPLFLVYENSDHIVSLCLVFLAFEVETLVKRACLGLVQIFDVSFTLLTVQRICDVYGLLMLSMLRVDAFGSVDIFWNSISILVVMKVTMLIWAN